MGICPSKSASRAPEYSTLAPEDKDVARRITVLYVESVSDALPAKAAHNNPFATECKRAAIDILKEQNNISKQPVPRRRPQKRREEHAPKFPDPPTYTPYEKEPKEEQGEQESEEEEEQPRPIPQ